MNKQKWPEELADTRGKVISFLKKKQKKTHFFFFKDKKYIGQTG